MRHVTYFRPSCFSDIHRPGSYVTGCKRRSSDRPASVSQQSENRRLWRAHNGTMQTWSTTAFTPSALVTSFVRVYRMKEYIICFAMLPRSCHMQCCHISLRNRLQQHIYMRGFLACECKSPGFYLRYVTDSLLHVTPVIL